MVLLRSLDLSELRPVRAGVPRPLIPKPESRQDLQIRRFGAAIVNADLDQDVFASGLRILDKDVEVAVLVEDARVEQLVLEFVAAADPARLNQIAVGIGCLRVLVEVLHVRVRGRAVEVEVVLLHILAVIAFAVGQAEEPFLENRILSVPQGNREAETLLLVRDAGQPVFSPAIGA